MSKIQHSFKLSTLTEQIHDHHYITLPIRYNYAAGFVAYLKERSKVILDQIASKSTHLDNPTSLHFDANIRKHLETAKAIYPDLAFIPAFYSNKHDYKKNIEFTKEIHSWFAKDYNINNLAGLILGNEPDEWIEWIKLCWGRNSWGVLTENNIKAVEMLIKEAKELKILNSI
jgi:hypothetical protein